MQEKRVKKEPVSLLELMGETNKKTMEVYSLIESIKRPLGKRPLGKSKTLNLAESRMI